MFKAQKQLTSGREVYACAIELCEKAFTLAGSDEEIRIDALNL